MRTHHPPAQRNPALHTPSLTISDHITSASDLIHATARATVAATQNPHEAIPHIDAAQAFVHAAEFFYEAAEHIAAGEAVGADRLALALRFADAKAAEGRWMLETGGQ